MLYRPGLLQGIEAAIIDLDGAMVDTLGDFVEVLRRMLADVGLPPVAATEVERMVGKGTEHLIASVLHHVLAVPQHDPAARQVAEDALFHRTWDSYQQHYLQLGVEQAVVSPATIWLGNTATAPMSLELGLTT